MKLTQEELRRKWVEALRSGEFEQCKKALHNGNAFCCLGVACVVAAREGAVELTTRAHAAFTDRVGYCDGRGTEFYSLPDKVVAAFGIRTEYGEYNDGALYKMNDEEGKTFAEIADIIESNPPGLFVNDGGGTHV